MLFSGPPVPVPPPPPPPPPPGLPLAALAFLAARIFFVLASIEACCLAVISRVSWARGLLAPRAAAFTVVGSKQSLPVLPAAEADSVGTADVDSANAQVSAPRMAPVRFVMGFIAGFPPDRLHRSVRRSRPHGNDETTADVRNTSIRRFAGRSTASGPYH